MQHSRVFPDGTNAEIINGLLSRPCRYQAFTLSKAEVANRPKAESNTERKAESKAERKAESNTERKAES